MSLSFLSWRDVEGWVPEPAPSKGGACFVAKLFVAINRTMAALASVLSKTDDNVQRRCRNESERFFLWGQGLSIVDGDLDEVLAYSKELHFRVLSLLLRLGTVTLQGLSRTPASLSQALKEQCDELRTLLDTTEAMLQEPEPDGTARSYSPSNSDVSDYEATEIVEEIFIYVDCLLDLSSSLDNPALDIQVEGSDEPLTQPRETFHVSSEEALIYCRKLRDRFEALPKYLAERLAEANVIRAAELRELRSRPTKHDAPIGDDFTESLFSTTNPRLTETTKSTAPSTSYIVESSRRRSKDSFEDNASEATFASFSTTMSATSMGRPRVPPLPSVQWNGFTCPFCFVHVANVKTRTEWKKHVFEDLRPYVCTIEDCKEGATLYNHSGAWGRHEASHPSPGSRSSECPFCAAVYVQRGVAYYKHVSAHLREVSLSVLPQPAGDDDEGFDTDNSTPLSSSSIAEAVNLGTHVHRKLGEDPLSPEIEAGGGQDLLVPGTDPVDTEPGPATDSGEKTTGAEPTTSSVEPATQAAGGSTSNAEDIDLDAIIDLLLEVRGSRPGKQVQLLQSEIRYLCTKSREAFISQPILLELQAPIKIVGDLHGQYYDLLRSFEYGGFPPEANYLFLGNYVDHGKQSIETICLILAYKIKYPENFFPLRGNHECASINRIEGFYDECKRRYDIRLWKMFTDTFNCMPVAAIIDEKVFCTHGGLSPDLNSMEQIRRIMRPTDIPDVGLLCDLLWSDPDKDITGWSENDRGVSFTFGPAVVSRFLEKHDLDLIVRGHQVVEDGYEFFSMRQLVTVWGAPNYKGEYDNAAAMMSIDESLLCSFQLLKPAEKRQRFGRR